MNKTKVSNSKKGLKTERKQSRFIYIFVLVILVALAFAKSTSFDFVDVDDAKMIYENPLIIDSSIPFSHCFTRLIHTVHYKPLVFMSWKGEYELFGDNPSHFHLINWLLHLANSILLFFIGINLFRRLYINEKWIHLSALGLALLFALNPLRIESVAWATERKDVLFSFFFLMGWLIYILYIKKGNKAFIAISSLCYLLSGLSKSMGLTLIFVIMLTDYWFRREFSLKLVWEKISFLAVFLILLYLYGLFDLSTSTSSPVHSVSASNGSLNPVNSLAMIQNLPSSIQWIITASVRFILWMVHCLIPVELSILYPHNIIYNFLGKSIFIFPFIVGTLLVWTWIKRKKFPVFFWGILFFGLTLAPALMLNTTGVFVFLSDRYTYISSIGLFIIVIVLINEFSGTKFNPFIITGIIIAFYFVGTVTNIKHWKNSEELFLQAKSVNPESTILYLNLGKYYVQHSEYKKAFEIYNEGIKKDLENTQQLYLNRGGIYLNTGQFDLAIKDFNKYLSVVPNGINGLTNRGIAYLKRNELDKAFNDFNEALRINPDDSKALSNRGFIFFQRRDINKAVDDFIHYLKINPDDAAIHNILGLCYVQLQQYEKALTQYNLAIDSDKSNGTFYKSRGLIYNLMGNKKKALEDLTKAKALGAKVDDNMFLQLQN